MSNCVTNLHPQSEQIGEAFYEVRWYGESREFRHLIRMMLMRTNRGFRLDVSWFMQMSLPTLMAVSRVLESKKHPPPAHSTWFCRWSGQVDSISCCCRMSTKNRAQSWIKSLCVQWQNVYFLRTKHVWYLWQFKMPVQNIRKIEQNVCALKKNTFLKFNLI